MGPTEDHFDVCWICNEAFETEKDDLKRPAAREMIKAKFLKEAEEKRMAADRAAEVLRLARVKEREEHEAKVAKAREEEQEKQEKRIAEIEKLIENAPEAMKYRSYDMKNVAKRQIQTKEKGYSVWSRQRNKDRFYYGTGHEVDFDSSWPTKKEANMRATYLFYTENYFNSVEELFHDELNEEEVGGLVKFFWKQCDYPSSWEVGVCPDAAFKFMNP